MTFQPAIVEAVLAPREAVTSLRFVGRAIPPLGVSSVQRSFTIGAGGCDLVVPGIVSGLIDALHADLVRVGTGLRVHDHHSAHGLFRARRGPRVSELHVEAGDIFWLADAPLLALDPHLEVLRGRVGPYVGLDHHAAADEAIEAIADGGPLVILGPRGMDSPIFARAIHDASAQRPHSFIVATDALVALPPGATVFVDLDTVRKLTASFAARLFDPSTGVRVIFAAAHERRARSCLDRYRDRVRCVSLLPLADRRSEIVRLLALVWRDELRSGRRVDELAHVDAIAAHGWPGGLRELREHAPRLLAFLDHGALGPAARALGITRQTLTEHFWRIGFSPKSRSAESCMVRSTAP